MSIRPFKLCKTKAIRCKSWSPTQFAGLNGIFLFQVERRKHVFIARKKLLSMNNSRRGKRGEDSLFKTNKVSDVPY